MPNHNRKRPNDLVAVGELLIDFISTEFAENLSEVSKFERFKGGSPANLAANMGYLGNKTTLVATVGKDAMGDFLMQEVQKTPVDCSYVKAVDSPTTLILVTRSQTDSTFQPYLGATAYLSPEQIPNSLLADTAIYHTTCHALSLEPARTTIMEAAHQAAKLGCQLSIDVNYAFKLWKNRRQAQKIIKEYCSLGAIIKCSEVDWERIYETPLTNPEEGAKHFISLGASEVCMTMGTDGSFGMRASGQSYRLAIRPTRVLDTTGAGDAFWSGYLTAWLDNKSLKDCMLAGRSMAEIKLAKVGQIDEMVDKERIYSSTDD